MRYTRLPVHALLVVALGFCFAGCQANTPTHTASPNNSGIHAKTTAAVTPPAAGSIQAPAAQAYAKGLPGVDAGHRIAVLIPLHGKLSGAGLAIQQGMIAAWFRQRAAGQPVPQIRFLDTSGADFDSVYDAAVDGGADVIIGPLQKNHLHALQQRPRLTVTTIALNYADAGEHHDRLFFFGLAGEDEAAQVARQLLAGGYKRPAVLLPAEEWGQRIALQFASTLSQGGARTPVIATYQGNSDYGAVVRSVLDLAASEDRHRRLERLLGISLAFAPSPRQDIDSLFIVGNTLQGTQLVPAIRYHHADHLPIYATSHINGQSTPDAMRDLNGIRFVEMPWLSRAEQPLRDDVRQITQDTEPAYTRLNALGADALLVAEQLQALQFGRPLDGVTGRLTMDEGRAVRRELDWMQFRNGAATPDERAD